jgi:hypothetical protein
MKHISLSITVILLLLFKNSGAQSENAELPNPASIIQDFSAVLNHNNLDTAKMMIEKVEQIGEMFRTQNDFRNMHSSEIFACWMKSLYNLTLVKPYETIETSRTGLNYLALYHEDANDPEFGNMYHYIKYSLLSAIESAYSDMLLNYDSSLYYLDLMEAFQRTSPDLNIGNWAEIYLSRAHVYRWIGSYKKADFYYTKVMNDFDERTKADTRELTLFADDTINYIRAIQGFLESQKHGNGMDKNQRYLLVKRAEDLAARNPMFLTFQILLLFDEAYLHHLNNDYKQMKTCLFTAENILLKNVTDYYNSYYYSLLLSNWEDYYLDVKDWDKAILFSNKLEKTELGSRELDFLEAYWGKRDTVNAQK